VFTARYGLIAYIQQNAFSFTARYGLIAYMQQLAFSVYNNSNSNNNINLLQLGCHPVAVVILNVYNT